jgi:hypothetical protein
MKVLEPSLDDEDLAQLECDTFRYFADEMNAENGLVPDNTRQGAPCSIAVVGFALTAYPIGVERGYITRAEAIKRSLVSLRFFHDGLQGTGPDAIGYKGFYYHFLDMKTGRRVWNSEISTIDTTYVLAAMQKRNARFANLQKRFILAPTGIGRRMAVSQSRTDGNRRRGLSNIVGPDTAKR